MTNNLKRIETLRRLQDQVIVKLATYISGGITTKQKDRLVILASRINCRIAELEVANGNLQ